MTGYHRCLQTNPTSSNHGNTMKITERRLRSIIRDMILTEAPLAGDGIYRYEMSSEEDKEFNEFIPSGLTDDTSSISYKQSKSPSWRAEAHVLMRNTPDNWAIVTAAQTVLINFNDTKRFNQWLRSQEIPKGTRILAIGSASFPGDYESVAWVIGHDIIGHTLAGGENDRLRSLGISVGGSNPIVDLIHSFLPDDARISTDSFDYLPDIFAAIFLNVVSRTYFVKKINTLTDDNTRNAVSEVLDVMFDVVETWISRIPKDRLYVIKPW